jgi:CheY-like chemotaxis protein
MEQWKIIYVDDSTLELRSVQSVLRDAGYDILTSTDGEGLAPIIGTCDLVIIDYHLAGTTGTEVLDRMRKLIGAASPKKPLFYLYTSDQEVGADYRAMGFDGRLILKGNPDALLKQLDAVQRAQRLRKMRPGS